MKKNSIIAIIILFLVLVTAVFFFKGCTKEASETKIYSTPGTYAEKETYKNGEIQSSGVSIENASFTGNVLITPAVGEGDVHFVNTEVKGEILVTGGQEGIYFNGGNYQKITIQKKGVKIYLNGDAHIDSLNAEETCTIIAQENSSIKNLTIQKNAAGSSVTTKDKALIETIQSKGKSEIILNTASKSVSFGPDATGSKLTTTAVVDKIQAESQVELFLNANVQSLVLSGIGEKSTVTLANNAKINSMATDSKVEINGAGSIVSMTTSDSENITGTIIPEAVYVMGQAIVEDPQGGLTAPTAPEKTTSNSSGISSQGKASEERGADHSNNTYSSNDTSFLEDSYYYEDEDYSADAGDDEDSGYYGEDDEYPPVSDGEIQNDSETVVVGNNLQLETILFPNDATDQLLIWESSNPGIAIVENGLVIPIRNGEVTITVRTPDGNEIASFTVTVLTEIAEVTAINGLDASDDYIFESIDYGDRSYGLPAAVMVRGSDNTEILTPVTWDPETIDSFSEGVTIYVGKLNPLSGYLNDDGVQAKIELTVRSQPDTQSSRLYDLNTAAMSDNKNSSQWLLNLIKEDRVPFITAANQSTH